jgi:hypothetical protein
VAVAALGGVPHFLKITGGPTGCSNDRVPGLRVFLQQADDLALGKHRICARHNIGVSRDSRFLERCVRIQRGRPLCQPLIIASADPTLPFLRALGAGSLDCHGQSG